MAKPKAPTKVKIRVPQDDDEITITRNGDIDDPTVYKVTEGVVEVDEDDVAHFLSVVTGSETADSPRAEPTLDTSV